MWAVFTGYTAPGICYVALVMNHVSSYPQGSASSLFKYKQKGDSSCRIVRKYPVYLTCVWTHLYSCSEGVLQGHDIRKLLEYSLRFSISKLVVRA